MSDIRVELANCTQALIDDINGGCTRNSVALTYAMALFSSEKTDWKSVNEAIMKRWSVNALNYIKKRAWKLIEEKRSRS